MAEMGVTARGLVHAAEILTGSFHLITTNVPYLGRGKQDAALKEFCEAHHKDAKADLATCFVERCLTFCAKGGTVALVTPQNWLFLITYKNLRRKLITQSEWNFVARLGARAFETIGGEVVNVTLLSLTNCKPTDAHLLMGIDVSEEKTPAAKAAALLTKPVIHVNQKGQLENPGATIVLEEAFFHKRLSDYADCYLGICTGDFPRFGRSFWELTKQTNGWEFQQTTVDTTSEWGGMTKILYWEEGHGNLYKFVEERLGQGNAGTWLRGKSAWGRLGVAIKQMGNLPVSIFSGDLYDNNVAVLIPKNEEHLSSIWAYCSSDEFNKQVRKSNQALAVDTQYFLAASFDLAHWQKVAAKNYPNGLPKPHSDDPTQWLFDGHPKNSDLPLQVAVSRLLGYLWPRQTGSSFTDCPDLGSDGLEAFADEDGIVCLNAVKGEEPAAERLRSLLAVAYGSDWSAAKQAELLEQVGFSGKTLEDWLRNGFFEQHCRIFHQRPFIWQIWDGLRDGFSTLANYHRLDHAALEKLTYAYLGDWIARQRAAMEAGEEGSDVKLSASLVLKAKLEKILEGEPLLDIFIRWKPLDKQPIGWQPDLNDGVRLNIRPFVLAGVLRKNPNINWNKDRGKDTPGAPWVHKFKGERINDHHLTLAEKQSARGK